MLAVSVTFLMEELRRTNEIVKTFLPVLLDSLDMPFLTELAATSNVGNNIHSIKVVHEYQVH